MFCMVASRGIVSKLKFWKLNATQNFPEPKFVTKISSKVHFSWHDTKNAAPKFSAIRQNTEHKI